MTDEIPAGLSVKGRDLRADTDALRPHYAVIKTNSNEWTVLAHAEVLATACDHERFSSAVSRYLQVPNGLDGDEHSRYRAVIEPYLTAEAILPFVPAFTRIAKAFVANLPTDGTVIDAVQDIGAVFAVRAQCAWLDWPASVEPQLLSWIQQNHTATRSGEQAQTEAAARQFDEIIRAILASKKLAGDHQSVTGRLSQEKVAGRFLTESELVSILRNWTGGDLGSMALCIGVLVAYLITESERDPSLLANLRQAPAQELELFIDEVLRLDNPFVSSRRVTTCPVQLGDYSLPAGARVKLNWTSANRDDKVFAAQEFNGAKHAANNLVYGVGKHVCPGRTLATWQLRILLEALLHSGLEITAAPHQAFERETAPLGGYHKVPIVVN